MQETSGVTQEASEDVFFGQIVTIWARWFLIVAGVILTLWVTTDANTLAFGIIPVVALVAVNFYLHGRYLTEKPANRALIAVLGVVDLAIITLAVLVWPGGKGIFSPFFVLYFPVILAFAFVMPRKSTVVFTVVALAVYAGTAFLSEAVYSPKSLYPDLYDGAYARAVHSIREVSPVAKVGEAAPAEVKAGDSDKEAAIIAAASIAVKERTLSSGNVGTIKALLMRLITLAAMGGLGTYYWRIQRQRRREGQGQTPGVPDETAQGHAQSVEIDPSLRVMASGRSNPGA